ncbi:MAG: phosphotransferase [Ardenticatenaceae bacterium]
MILPEALLRHLSERLPEFEAAGMPEPLQGGYLNYVWRVRGTPNSAWGSVIIKHAPSHIAAMPDVPLDPRRILIEANALTAFGAQGACSAVASSAIRAPHLFDLDASQHILIMEDVGEHVDLGAWLHQGRQGSDESRIVGSQLGEFIGRLHLLSYGDQQLAPLFANQTIQQTRLEVQYRVIEELAIKCALSDAKMLGERALALGEQFLQPGSCVIMGDLWPPSLLMTSAGLRVIDWELAHFGQPAQDIGHLVAHLWMQRHRAPNRQIAAQADILLQSLLQSYRTTLGDLFDPIFGTKGIHQSSIHFGAELFVRTVGAFQSGYLYDGLSIDHPLIQEAVQVAAAHIRTPERVDTFKNKN